MIDHKASWRYAKALLGMAKDIEELAVLDADFTKIRSLVDQHPEIRHLMVNSTISRAEKEDLVTKFFSSDVSTLMLNFIKVLVKKHRFAELYAIQEEFHRRYEKKRGIQRVQVVSPVKLPEDVLKKLESVLAKKLAAEIILDQKEEPEMIGGLVIRFDGNEINASFKDRLNEIRQKLIH